MWSQPKHLTNSRTQMQKFNTPVAGHLLNVLCTFIKGNNKNATTTSMNVSIVDVEQINVVWEQAESNSDFLKKPLWLKEIAII